MDTAVPGRVRSVRASALARRNVAAFNVGDRALFIRRVVVFRRTFAGARIVFFRFLLHAFGKV